ncbi:MAG: YhfC family intramembrane metalloprotease [Endomicrobium sp.]|uniref:YhfC family glutamic-type intramembrane protease n=1 Tax=Candidatus Endomicrobiellum cubanum TaxID=3242325 RepID=UPI00281BDDEE|nr:YhfC family intramembrane metalloprotease [Endomicrobium sp.]
MFVISLFESYLAFHYIRIPLDDLIKYYANIIPIWYCFITFLYAPVIEEIAKILPILVFPVYKNNITKENIVLYGSVIGLGFGIGEMFLISSFIVKDIAFIGYKWYHFYGYIYERIISCFCHQIFTIVALSGIEKCDIKYLLYAMVLHAILNIPAFLYQGGFINANSNFVQYFLLCYPLIFVVAIVATFFYVKKGK